MMVDYYPSKEERLIQSKCISLGIIVCPKAIEPTKKKSLVTIEVDYKGTLKPSSQPPFEQKYLTYKIMQVYKAFYEKIKDKL